MDVLAPILFVVVFAAIVAAAVALMLRNRRRDEKYRHDSGPELAELAQQRGWTYRAEETGYADRFTGFPFTQTARGRISRDLIHGVTEGREFTCLAYTPTPMTVGERKTYSRYYRVFTLRLAREVPTLQITPTKKDVRPRGDEDFAQTVLNPALRTAVNARGLPLRFEGDLLLTWYEQKGPFGQSDVDSVLAYLTALAGLLPADVGRPTVS
ncbi:MULTISPECIES: hypothetical protein [Prauserella salsuginis group]|uniref:Secreted protein n=1 Tax=Prauserella salsuginis TaxID=387889 RepID=A0ABW6GAM7_9PSEU|nr:MULTISPECIES: hypothetical protein [Prauserella salsuginis group]MCR3720678.1 hypothetical protein [Prauserella flava]MCR3735241.1 hypothetical protein [Prauserella salsuginis]